MPLERETAYFESHKSEMLQHYLGQFALIHGDDLLGTFTRFEEAFDEGIKRLGNHPFLIRQVVEDEAPVQFPALVLGMISAHA
jgi:hypothetical protein